MRDLSVENHGTIVLLRPITDAAREWLEANTSEEAQWFGGALAVEPRYVVAILEGADAEGLTYA